MPVSPASPIRPAAGVTPPGTWQLHAPLALTLALALAPAPPEDPGLPAPAETGGGAGDSVALHPLAAVSTLKTSGCPVKEPPAVIVIAQRPPADDVATVELPLASAGASKTTWRPAALPGTPYASVAPAAPFAALAATT